MATRFPSNPWGPTPPVKIVFRRDSVLFFRATEARCGWCGAFAHHQGTQVLAAGLACVGRDCSQQRGKQGHPKCHSPDRIERRGGIQKFHPKSIPRDIIDFEALCSTNWREFDQVRNLASSQSSQGKSQSKMVCSRSFAALLLVVWAPTAAGFAPGLAQLSSLSVAGPGLRCRTGESRSQTSHGLRNTGRIASRQGTARWGQAVAGVVEMKDKATGVSVFVVGSMHYNPVRSPRNPKMVKRSVLNRSPTLRSIKLDHQDSRVTFPIWHWSLHTSPVRPGLIHSFQLPLLAVR